MPLKPDYCTRAELKAFLRIEEAFTADDGVLDSAITTASRIVDNETRRQFGKLTESAFREYSVKFTRSGTSYSHMRIDDIYSLTNFSVEMDGTDITDRCELLPRNALMDGIPYDQIVITPKCYAGRSILIGALWGWASVPIAIKEATMMLASRRYSRRDAPFGVIGSAEMGNQMFITKQDNDVKAALQPYYLWW